MIVDECGFTFSAPSISLAKLLGACRNPPRPRGQKYSGILPLNRDSSVRLVVGEFFEN